MLNMMLNRSRWLSFCNGMLRACFLTSWLVLLDFDNFSSIFLRHAIGKRGQSSVIAWICIFWIGVAIAVGVGMIAPTNFHSRVGLVEGRQSQHLQIRIRQSHHG